MDDIQTATGRALVVRRARWSWHLDRRRLTRAREAAPLQLSAAFGEECGGARSSASAPATLRSPATSANARPVGISAGHEEARRSSQRQGAELRERLVRRLLEAADAAPAGLSPVAPARRPKLHGPRRRGPGSCDVVVYDRLAPRPARPGAAAAEAIYVGKSRAGRHAAGRDRRAPRRTRARRPGVVRLKGGTRSSGAAARTARVHRGRRRLGGVPGITSASRRRPRVPVTHRGVAQSFGGRHGSTAHGDEVDLARVATSTTRSSADGGRQLAGTCAELIAAGRQARSPRLRQWGRRPSNARSWDAVRHAALARPRGSAPRHARRGGSSSRPRDSRWSASLGRRSSLRFALPG